MPQKIQMERMTKTFFSIFIAIGMTSCGVKGKPLAPLEPPPIGNGEPLYLNKKDEKKPPQKR